MVSLFPGVLVVDAFLSWDKTDTAFVDTQIDLHLPETSMLTFVETFCLFLSTLSSFATKKNFVVY